MRIGILGASFVARWALLAPLQGRTDFVVTAVAARDAGRARLFAQQFGIPSAATDYAALVARDDVDLVYNGLVPSDHCEWSVRALAGGKHVLCEKPFALNAAEARRMVAAARANRRILLEAWHYRFHPSTTRILEIVRSGVLGPLRQAQATFEAGIESTPHQFRWHAELGGGALMDTGGYTIHVLRTAIGREPVVISATAERRRGVDTQTTAMLDFGQGLAAQIKCSMVLPDASGQRSVLSIVGEQGSLSVEGFALPHLGSRLCLKTSDGVIEEIPAAVSTYAMQLAHVADVIVGGAAPVTGGRDAIANMRVIDAIKRAVKRAPT